MEFSKISLIFSWTVTLSLSALTVWMSLNSLPVDAVLKITELSWTETLAHTGFYCWKAKNENRAKHGQKFLKEFAEQYGADIAVRMAEIVLKD
jgi:hypothetical protein